MVQIRGGRLAYWLTRRSLCSDNSSSSLYYSWRGFRTSPWMLRDASRGKGSRSVDYYYEVFGVPKDLTMSQIEARYDEFLQKFRSLEYGPPEYKEEFSDQFRSVWVRRLRNRYISSYDVCTYGDSSCAEDVIVTCDEKPQPDLESVKSKEIQVQQNLKDVENSTTKKTTTTKARVCWDVGTVAEEKPEKKSNHEETDDSHQNPFKVGHDMGQDKCSSTL